MKIEMSENLMSNPTAWHPEKWILYFRTYLAFMGAENMKEAKEAVGLETDEVITAIESFIMGLLYHDVEISGPTEMLKRREQFMQAVKGLENYAKIVKMDKVEFFKKAVEQTTH